MCKDTRDRGVPRGKVVRGANCVSLEGERQNQVGQQAGLHMRNQRSGRQAGVLQAPGCNFAGQG
jgi:hypothetical protein